MKHILASMALVALMSQTAIAQVNTDGLLDFTMQRIAPPSLVPAKHAPSKEGGGDAAIPGTPTLPAHVMVPPPMFDGPYKGGQLIVTKWNDYSLIRMICKDTVNPIACSYKTYETASGKLISCLIMLGPVAHNSAEVMRHEIAHCNGWTNAHEGAR